MFKSTIETGANTSLWFDPWLPDGRTLINSYHARILASTNLLWDAKVDSIIQNGNWSFPVGHPDLSTAWSSITFQPRVHRLDRLVWAGHHSGNFNIASAWDFIRRKRQTHPYACITRFPGHIPSHAFILWLAMRGRLATMNRPHVQRKERNNRIFNNKYMAVSMIKEEGKKIIRIMMFNHNKSIPVRVRSEWNL
ncbi:hypothetical protein OIU77_004296 [Salix suchowensis]|uniref:Reverse transcriptase zinc-binding domain-containing protein n=1 Tax=Salix suchowensis TaxID=1278906 RepID=A0ABQ9AW69_9ROSI|nr:hypothetical protein OIU77_004296 [Salix suchowensis]